MVVVVKLTGLRLDVEGGGPEAYQGDAEHRETMGT
jgi:hypothetical protein